MTDGLVNKRIAMKLLAGGKSRAQRVKAHRTGMKMAQTAMNRRVYKATMAPETKFNDIFLAATASTSCAFQLMNGLVQGVTQLTRIGNKVQCKGIEVRGSVYTGATPNNSTMRIGVLIDFQADGSAPTQNDVWNAAGGGGTAVYAHRNINSTERYKIIKDEMISTSAAGPSVQNFVWHLPADVVTKYNTGNAGTIADIETGSVYFYYWSDDIVAGDLPVIDACLRYKFNDP